jgi:iron(III) transport system ATP-binding protein
MKCSGGRVIRVSQLEKVFGAASRRESPVVALQDVAFEVADGEFYVLLGPSGSGKTTTLRSVAGLEEPSAGEIAIDGEPVFSSERGVFVPPEDRPVAMVFQSYALWPHMSVYDNIAFPLRYGSKRLRRQDVRGRVQQVVEMLRLTEQLHRPVTRLSGGQQQRVALARAIGLEPKVLLMDEPLSNLDARLRAQLRLELKQLTRRLGITTLYVTHDQVEALAMGDRIAVMDHGVLLQEGSPWDLYRRPKHRFVARFLGDMNFLAGTLEASEGARATASTDAGPLSLRRADGAPSRGPVWVGIRPEDLAVAAGAGPNVIAARVAVRHFLGDAFVYELEAGPARLQMKRPPTDVLEPGQEVWLHVPPDSVVAFGPDEGLPATESVLEDPLLAAPAQS